MEYTPELGIAAPELSWVPAPTFVLRRAAVLDRARRWMPGRVLEIGCGPGAILFELSRAGFDCTGVEASARAREVAAELLADAPEIAIGAELPDPAELFDYLLAFEVLEHIDDDGAALADWVDRLSPGGQALLSVPAHRSKWNLTDLFAGHFRRYDRADVTALVESAGLEIAELSTYGWPATWVIERARLAVRTLQHRRRGGGELRPGDADRTHASGVDRRLETLLYPLYSNRAARALVRGAARVQRLFYSTDWGISYLVLARKP